jgi:hypothetical protein
MRGSTSLTAGHRLLPQRTALRLAWISNVAPGDGAARQSILPTDVMTRTLDGRIVNVFDRRWRISVFSISDHSGFRWLQLLLEGRPDYSIIARISPEQSLGQTLRAISAWLANPSRASHILNVA